ncbi:MAG: hypothetical protein HYR56_25530 [Acidobacteria bacterium]|nr:hypothetical protein [Acidobacteriota bacterium]MBI3423304.1 hypothetical protein [Acidobacteriota bacterium]
MKKRRGYLTSGLLSVLVTLLSVFGLLPYHNAAQSQIRQEPGRSIGTIRTQGDLIVMELNEGALGKANMFDLGRRTLRFTPEGTGYRAENVALKWDAEFGAAITNPQITLRNFAFPFSGKSWEALSVGLTGSISFGAPPNASGMGGPGGLANRGGGVSIDRFAQLQEAARTLLNTTPAICVFFKPRMSGTRYVKELADRVVITWSLTEPVGGIQDFTWTPTVNRFQAVLWKDGAIELSYEDIAARDAIVGLYPLVNAGVEKELAVLKAEENPAVAAHLDIKSVKVSAVDGLFLKVTLETRGPVLPEGEAGLAGLTYRVSFDSHKPVLTSNPDVAWTIRGLGPGGRGGGGRGGGTARYLAAGPGVAASVKVNGNTLTLQGTLPATYKAGDQIAIFAEAQAPGAPPVDQVPPQTVTLAGIRSPEVDLSTIKRQDGPFTALYESFHYLSLPNPRDLTCTVIKALGDKFDFLAYYSDFRVDNQEAGTPSTGPLGGGPAGGAVTGIGATQRGLDAYCSAGRFQWQFVQPVYIGSNQGQERPPAGTKDTSDHNVAFYTDQLSRKSTDGRMPPYNYAMSQIGHEMGHRWSAFVSAKVNGETIPLGPTHWARGLHAPVAFPYQRPTEASAMGGGVWQDNFDGTYTQLDDDYYVPATGWSYLELYLMGLAAPAEVPDFFILRNLVTAGRDANGHPIFKADRTKLTIQDVIAAEGPRLPAVENAQKKFNTGMVVIVEHGATPSKELIERTNAIREQWMDYWATTTGRRSSMTTNSK